MLTLRCALSRATEPAHVDHLQDLAAPTGRWKRAFSRADNAVTKDDVAEAMSRPGESGDFLM
jgi:hypothetical protein